MSFKPVVQTDATGKWYDNALRFETAEEADAWAADLMRRWTLVLDYSYQKSEDPVNYKMDLETKEVTPVQKSQE